MIKKIILFCGLVLMFYSCKEPALTSEELGNFYNGKLLFDQGQLTESSKIFKEISAKYPKFYESKVMYAKSLYFSMDYSQVVEFCKKDLKRDPELYELNFWLGKSYIELEEFYLAEEVFLKMISFNSQDYLAMNQLALINMKKNEIMKSIEMYKKALLHRNSLGSTALNLSKLYYSQGMMPEVLLTLNTVLELSEPDSDISLAAIEILTKLKENIK
ncbi:MAG: hypothetical protein JXR64_02130 [Spirochaetales bacterium]|nr:hypothetical protein [Spirochaetales bacterium]